MIKSLLKLKSQLQDLSHKEAVAGVLERGFMSIYLPSFKRISEVANYIAPEHLELQVADEHIGFLTDHITTAGAFLLGHETATTLGDFIAGPSHVLPTGRSSQIFFGSETTRFFKAFELYSV